jgi:DNA-binding NtrC family response regulator
VRWRIEDSSVTEFSGYHVLVIDDDQTLRAIYAEILADVGCRVTARSEVTADSIAIAALAPDLIILDLIALQMWDDRWVFLSQLKSHSDTASIPVIVSTTSGPFGQESGERLAEWMCGSLIKPFDLDDFLSLLSKCLATSDRARLIPLQLTSGVRALIKPPLHDGKLLDLTA